MKEVQPNIDDQVQRHSAVHSPHTHMHNGRPCSGHHGHQQQQQQQTQPNNSIYFKMLKDSYKSNRVFFWNQILDGGPIDELIKRYSFLSVLKYFRSNLLQKFASTVLGFATQFLPNILKPFFAGFFLPLLIFLYVNWKLLSLRIYPELGEDSVWATIVYAIYLTIIILFTLVGIVGPGSLASEENRLKTQKLISQKPFMNNPRLICSTCEIIKGFRCHHCPNCKECIPKFSKHSPVFNRCIGASNELLYFLFNLSLFLGLNVTISLFMIYSPSDMLLGTKITVFLINNHISWLALVQAFKIFILNIWYNLTEYEAKNWMFSPYLIAFGKREFFNPLDIGLINNIRQSLYSLLGCQQSEEQSAVIVGSIIQPEQNPKKFINNWAKALYTSGSQLRNHPHRREIAMKTKQMQNMILMQTRIMNKVRQEVLAQQQGKRPIHEINQIIMMQTQMELQKELQKIMMQKMQKAQSKVPKVQKRQSEEHKGEQNQRLIEDRYRQESAVQLKLEQENDN